MSLIIKNRIQEFDVKEYYKKIYKGSKAEFMKKLEGEIEAGKKQCVVCLLYTSPSPRDTR